ncbi:MAG: hypothetical protein AAFQ82_12880 [Myxococcota bacterium]
MPKTPVVTVRSISLLFVLILASSDLGATTIQYASLQERVDRSTWIVHARVTEAASPVPFTTRYELEILSRIKAPDGRRVLTLTVPGGRDGHLEMRIPGMPRLIPNETAVLLLEESSPGVLIFTGLGLGVFTVSSNGMTSQSLFGAELLDHAHPTEIPEGSLAELIAVLRALSR